MAAERPRPASVPPAGPRSSDREATTIRAYPDGPFLVRGPITVVDGEGIEVRTRRAVIALCRCGRSRTQPLCDGTHTPAGFTCAGAGAQDR